MTAATATGWLGARVFVEELGNIAARLERAWVDAGRPIDAAILQSRIRDEQDERFIGYFSPGAATIVDTTRTTGAFRRVTLDWLEAPPRRESVAFGAGDRSVEASLPE